MQPFDLSADEIREEVQKGKGWLAGCGVPPAAVVGWRTPYLKVGPSVRQAVAAGGFLYDRCAGVPCAGCAALAAIPGSSCTKHAWRRPALDVPPQPPRIPPHPPPLRRSTQVEDGFGKSLTRGPGARVWPWNMAAGLLQSSCAAFDRFQKCDPGERYPGVWQVPCEPAAAAAAAALGA